MNASEYLQKLTEIRSTIEPWLSKFPEIELLLNLKKGFTEKISRLSAEEVKLNIAIMGQVKAGKSSFLNALLFGGQQVLPEAATPKTANLTRISWAENPFLKVEYYSREEWQFIECLAGNDGEHAEVKVARELVSMLRLSGVDVNQAFDKGQELIPAESLEGLMEKLNQYAGNNGCFTPIVKMTHLFLPIDDLKGFDIVDTPGMNDPVVSRTEKTREEMARADVVFFLSRCSQFLDQSDMELLGRQLPGKGVKRMVLVAGQFDSAILDDGFDRTSLSETEANLKRRLGTRAEVEMGKLADMRDQSGRPENAALLRRLTTPIFASTFSHGFASWPQSRWSGGMSHVHKQLLELAEDSWDGYEFTNEDWVRIANFNMLIDAYQVARSEKAAVLYEQQQQLLPELRTALTESLQLLHDSIDTRVVTLEKGDISRLGAQLIACERRIKGLSARLRDIVGQSCVELENTRRDILSDVRGLISRYGGLQVRDGTETAIKTQYHTHESGLGKLARTLTFGLIDTRIYERSYHTASSQYQYMVSNDAVEQVSAFAREAASIMELHFNKCVNRKVIRQELRSGLAAELDMSSQEYDPAQFRASLEFGLDKFDLPILSLDIHDAGALISRHFQGEVRGNSAMQALDAKLHEALRSIFEVLSERFERAVDEVKAGLITVQNTLESRLTDGVREELEHIRHDFEDKDRLVKEYRALLTHVNEYLAEIGNI